jgi:hypothetical protein
MVNNGDISRGADYAATVLQQLPTTHRPAIVCRRAHAVAQAGLSPRESRSDRVPFRLLS